MESLRRDLGLRLRLDKKRKAMKRILKYMVANVDMSPLFPEVLACMQLSDLDLKKATYMYIVNYAPSRPDVCLLSTNAFLKDAQDSRPQVRVLVLYAMSSIRLDKLMECLCEQVHRFLKDPERSVRVSAVSAIARAVNYRINYLEDYGFTEILTRSLETETEPQVISTILSVMHAWRQKKWIESNVDRIKFSLWEQLALLVQRKGSRYI
jgi:vesicle coat complex subunit